MERKVCSLALLLHLAGTILQAAEPTLLPAGAGSMQVPVGWQRLSVSGLVLRGPGTDPDAPRLSLAVADLDAAAAAASLRAGWQRITDGCEMPADEEEPLGGRVWRRLRASFAIGPVAIAQTAWIGTVAGRTVVVVLSASDERGASHLAAAAAAVASISGPR